VERLIELVAASFARNGIECPAAADLRWAGPVAMASAETMPNIAIHTTEATCLSDLLGHAPGTQFPERPTRRSGAVTSGPRFGVASAMSLRSSTLHFLKPFDF
jgi:hypothetical protein